MLVILMFVAWLLVNMLCFVAYHLRISCCLYAVMFRSHTSSSRIELVAQRHTLLLLSLVDLICYGLLLFLRVGEISARLGLANGLDDPVAC